MQALLPGTQAIDTCVRWVTTADTSSGPLVADMHFPGLMARRTS